MTDVRKVKITAVDPPQNLTAAENGYDRVDLNWAPVTDADLYSVYRSDSPDGVFTKISDTPSTSYSDTGLDQATTYYYKVTATSTGEESPQSDYAAATTRAIGIPIVTATARSSSEIAVSWNAIADATGYLVYRSTSPDSGFVLEATLAETDFLDTGLVPETTYYYRVRTRVGALTGGFSQTASATTLLAAPEAPTDFTASALNETEIELQWNAAPYAAGYRIYRSETLDGAKTLIADTTGLSHVDGGLNPITTYYYFIEAYNEAGVSAQAAAAATTIAAAPPVITSRFYCVTLRWCPVDADVYVVMRKSDREACFCPIARTKNNAVYDCGLIKGAAYEYKVFAACREGWRKIAEFRVK